MTGIIDSITGKTARDAAAQQQSLQRKSLADLAAESAQLDQATSSSTTPGRRTGRKLLIFLSGQGQSKLG